MDVDRGPLALTRLLVTLSEPTRRRVYEAVRAARRPSSRAEVAGSVGISTRLAAFHLDRLVEGAMLVAHYARPPGRPSGPGAGRTSKWYTPSAEGLEVSLPPRRNDIAARVLLRAAVAGGEAGAESVRSSARQTGTELAQHCDGDTPLEDLLADLGYEPAAAPGGGLDLVNCPFHELADQDRLAVCGMNAAMLDAAATAAHSTRAARFEPREGLCCVRFVPSDRSAAGS